MVRSWSVGNRLFLACLRFGGAVIVALGVMGVSLWIGSESAARAGGAWAEAPGQQAGAVPAERERSVAEVERKLKGIHERIAAVGSSVLAGIGERSRIRDSLINQQMATMRADASYKNATLAREVAEITVKEYEFGIFRQDQATLEGEVKLAESEVARAHDSIEMAEQRLARIKEVSKGTATEVAVEYSYEDYLLSAKRREPKAKIAFEQVQSKLKFLREFTKPSRMKQLNAEVERLRADENAKKAAWETEQSTERLLESQIAKIASDFKATRGLESLNRAFGIDDKIRAEIGKVVKGGAIDQAQAKTIKDLVNELEDVVEEVEAGAAAMRVDQLKAAIRQASSSSEKTAPGAANQRAAPAELSGYLAGIRKRVAASHGRMARLGEPLAKTIRAGQPVEINAAARANKIESAKAAMKSAVLAREGFEMELKGFLTATFPEEEAMYEAELALAKDDLEQAKKMQVVADERFERIKKLFESSAVGVDIENRFEFGRLGAELEEKKAGFSIEQAKSKLKVLREYTKGMRTKELESEIKRATSQELAAKAELTLAQASLRRARGTGKELSAPQKKLLTLLEQAIAVDDGVRSKIEALRKNGKTDSGLQKEITELTNQLETAVDRAEAEDALARFDALKRAVGR